MNFWQFNQEITLADTGTLGKPVGPPKLVEAQLNGPAGPELMQQGKRVMGIGPDGYWYPGTVKQVSQGQYQIRFDDNEEAWLPAHEVRAIC